MKINKFEEIIAWQRAKELNIAIYKNFSNSKDFGFNNQIQRAAVSIMNNIAEGFERQTNKEFKQFLYISKGSCGEVKSMLLLAKELKYIDEKIAEKYFELTDEISRLMFGLIKSLNQTNG